jgi:hypothetical protein
MAWSKWRAATISFRPIDRLAARHDPRDVVADSHARYFGAELTERSLSPADGARVGEIRFEEWLAQPVLQPR